MPRPLPAKAAGVQPPCQHLLNPWSLRFDRRLPGSDRIRPARGRLSEPLGHALHGRPCTHPPATRHMVTMMGTTVRRHQLRGWSSGRALNTGVAVLAGPSLHITGRLWCLLPSCCWLTLTFDCRRVGVSRRSAGKVFWVRQCEARTQHAHAQACRLLPLPGQTLSNCTAGQPCTCPAHPCCRLPAAAECHHGRGLGPPSV
jgi:hypothetical protein